MKRGIQYDFETGDIIIQSNGTFRKAYIDSQLCALIAVSEVCRLTKPEVGAQLSGRMQNRRNIDVARDISEAERQVERDGGTEVSIYLQNENLQFIATYDS